MELAGVAILILFCLWISCRPCNYAYYPARHKHNWNKDVVTADILDGPWSCYCGATRARLTLEEFLR